MAELNWGAVTNEGMIRTQNEDSLLVREGLFVVADGMGGHQAGEVASALAVSRMATNLEGTPGRLDALIASIRDANADIFDAAATDASQQGMGTTVTAVVVIATPSGDEALGLANVGDSRTYLFRHERLRRISIDHNYVQELIDAGHITPDEARNHPRRNIITRALGIEPSVRVDAWTMPLVRGDRFLLCSDGLVDEVTDDDIADVLATHTDPQRAAERLVEMANDAGGRDNITVVVVDVLDGAETPAADEIDLEPIWSTEPDDEQAEDTTEEVLVLADPDPDAADKADREAVAAGLLAPDDDAPLPAVPLTGGDVDADGAGASSGADDSKGASTGSDGVSPEAKGSDDDGDEPRRGRRRLTRFLASIVVLAVLVAGFVVFAAWARRGYFLAFDDDGAVVVYKGREGSVLWFDPTEEARSSLSRDILDADSIERVEGTPEFSSRANAETNVNDVLAATTTTVPTTTTTTTTTTEPPTTTTDERVTTTTRARTTTTTRPPRTSTAAPPRTNPNN
ncbi:MAG: Stp1/IreP family PP2C-type Ser/Thr phosphatase [Ilumatobacteraceae bacterium]